MKRNNRKEAIKEIISTQEVSTQGELTELLKKRGFETTQATVSRDINELELIKVAGIEKKFKYSLKQTPTSAMDKSANIFKESVLSIESSLNLIVIKTCEGSASGAAYFLDKLQIKNILGTISGDDTILMIVKEIKYVSEIMDSLKRYML